MSRRWISVELLFGQDPNWYTSVNPYGYDTAYGFMPTDYSYWHWGPDEMLDATNLPPGYANGAAYASASISNSFSDLAGWGLTNSSGLRTWVSPNFNATREPSYQIEQQLGIKTTGEEKLGPFPSWVLSTQTPDKRYPFITLPPSDWFIGNQIGQSLETGHTIFSVQNAVDYYYNLGALINLYSHSSSAGNAGAAGPQQAECVTYAMNSSLHPRLWAANSIGIYQWWLQRSNAQITAATFTTNGSQSQVTIKISGATGTNTAVEILIPGAPFTINQVLTNGVPANTNIFWTNGQMVKVLVGTSVTNAVINYTIYPSVQSGFYTTQEGTLLSVTVPGVLTNAVGGSGPLTALLASGPANGALTLNANGSFIYTPSNSFVGIDSFNYQATDGSLTSGVATVTIDVTPPGDLFFDNFARSANDLNAFFPWIIEDGTWTLTNNELQVIGNGLPGYYGNVYLGENWTDYRVQGQIQFSSTNMWAGGVGGRLNLVTGGHYAAWVYPEGSQGANYPPNVGVTGIPVLKLIKFQNWQADSSQFAVMQQVTLPPVGTNVHTVALAFQGTNINVYFDNALEISTNDSISPFTSGGITLDAASYPTPDTMSVDSVVVTTLPLAANNDSYSTAVNTTLTVGAPGVLANDVGTGLTAALVSGPADGILTFNGDGSFAYTPTNNFIGVDSFTYQASNGQTNSNIATVSIAVTQEPPDPINATNDNYSVGENTPLNVAAPGVLANDSGGSGPLTALLGSGPANGTLTLNSDGSFTYTPSNNFAGIDSFNYQATDGSITSSVATVTIDVTPLGDLFYDTFGRSTNDLNSLFPWIVFDGTWAITNDVLTGQSADGTYGRIYINNPAWTDYTVQEQFQFSTANGWGGGVGGRLDPTTGAHYAAWVYPDGSGGGPNVLKLFKFSDWGDYTILQTANLSSVGTGTHTLTLTLQSSNITVSLDGTLEISTNDSSPFTSGGISVDMATVGTPYTFGVDNVTVTTLPAVANNDSYSVPEDTTLTVEAPGVLGNDVGSGLTAVPVGGPANGVLTLNPDGSFSYTPNNGFLGMDTFTYEASNGQTNSNVATVSITVTPNPVVANNQSFSTFENSILTVGAPGVLTNDSGGSGNLTALLVSGPANGVLTLNGDGSFAYTTTNNFVGVDSFNYEATDGSITSGVATVAIDVTPPGEQFYDNFTRSGPGSNSLLPWIVFNGAGVNGTWAITNGVLTGQSVDGDYGYIYINNPNWTDYSVQGQIQFSTTDAWGGGIGGRLDPTTGAHYAAWVYPDSAGGGPNVTLWKFSDWTTPTLMQTVTLPPAGTTVHTVELTFQGANLNVYFDNTLEISTTDSTSPFTSGGISVDMATIGSSYTFGVSNVTVTSLLTGQTINFGALSSQTYGNAPFTVSATASSGLPVSLNILSGPATISGNTITITGAGTVTVQASQAGNTTYQAATNVDQSFTVFPAGLTVSGVTAQDKVYDGTTNATLSGTATLNGVVNGDDVSLVTGAVTAAFADPDTGTDLPVTVSGYAITGADAGNYTLTQPAGLTANITAATLTYTATPGGHDLRDGSAGVLSGSVSGFVGTDTQGSATTGTLTFTTMATSSSGAASYAINGSGLTANNGNYTFVQAAGNATALTIGALPVNLTGTRPYDGTTAVAAGILSVGNKAGSDDVTVASGGGTRAGAAVGSEAITSLGTLTLGGASAGNYTLSGASGSVSITASGLAVTNLLALDKVYDGTTNATLDATNAGLAGVLNGDSVTFVSSNAAAYFADKKCGDQQAGHGDGSGVLVARGQPIIHW